MIKIFTCVLTAASVLGFGALRAQTSPEPSLLESQSEPDDPRLGPSLVEPQAEPGIGPAATRREPPSPGTSLWALPPLEALSATRERPIFSATRRPPAVAAPPSFVDAEPPPDVAPAPSEEPPLELVGTVVGAADQVAIFVKSAERAVVRLRVGETDSGWTLVSVEPKTTTLEKADRQVTLALPAPGSTRVADAEPMFESADQSSGMPMPDGIEIEEKF